MTLFDVLVEDVYFLNQYLERALELGFFVLYLLERIPLLLLSFDMLWNSLRFCITKSIEASKYCIGLRSKRVSSSLHFQKPLVSRKVSYIWQNINVSLQLIS